MDDVMEVTVIDGDLCVYQAPDLSSSVMAQLPKGQAIRLSDVEVREGREWMKAAVADTAIGYVLGPSARGHTTLGAMFRRCAFCGQEVRSAALKCRFCGRTLNATLRAQEERDAEVRARDAAMHAYLRKSGIGWLIVAVAQFVFSKYLSIAWGIVCLMLGTLNLAYPRRWVLLVNAVALILIGIGNIAVTISSGGGNFTFFGIAQVIWGLKELKRYTAGDVRVWDS